MLAGSWSVPPRWGLDILGSLILARADLILEQFSDLRIERVIEVCRRQNY